MDARYGSVCYFGLGRGGQKNKARAILQATGDKLEWVKIGLQTYLRDGPDFVREVADSGKRVFLDLKLYDIPNTMAKALESLADLPIGMLTLHASAGPKPSRDALNSPISLCRTLFSWP